MDLPLGIIFGIIAMVGWGVADFFVAKAVRKTSVFKTIFWSQAIGWILFLTVLFLFNPPLLSFAAIGLVLIAAFLNAIAYLAFYKGLQIGKVSIISPVAASWSVVVVILSLIIFNEILTPLQAIGVVLAIAGAFLASFKLQDLLKFRLKSLATGIQYAIVALLAWGVHYIFVGVLVAELSWFLPIFFVKGVTVFYLLVYSRPAKKNISFPKNVAFFMIVIGVLEAVAYFSYGAGIASDFAAIVAPIAASFPIVTIILVRIFFKEVMETNQKIGVVSVLTGLILLST